MKNTKTNFLKISNNQELIEKPSKFSIYSENKRIELKTISHQIIKENHSLSNNGNLCPNKHSHNRNFSTMLSKTIFENDLTNKIRSLSKNNSKIKNAELKKSKNRNDNFFSISYDIENKKKLFNYSNLNEENIRHDPLKNRVDNNTINIENILMPTKKIKINKTIGQNLSNSNSRSTSTNIPNLKSLDTISITSLLSQKNNIPLNISNLKLHIERFEPSKNSVISHDRIRCYSTNTHQGIIRNYNEDRVSIMLNINKPSQFNGKFWPKCSFFGIYDGHGGSLCAEYLKDNLHLYIIKDSNFPTDPIEAIKKGFEGCEKHFINKIALNELGEVYDKSGSCALICLIVGDIIYIANVGDSRAILSYNGGEQIIPITIDHKPNEENEMKRIMNYGGKIYQTQALSNNFNIPHFILNNNIKRPYRVFPGRLSVSRTFGDVEAKLPKFGGIENVISAQPDVFSIKINRNTDYVLLGCDGIFDQLNDKEVNNCVWMTFNNNTKSKNIHSQSGIAVDMIIKSSLSRKTLDNVTCVLIGFENFEKIFNNMISEKNTKINNFSYNSNPTVSTEKKPPKILKTESNEVKISKSIQKDNLIGLKILPISAKNKKIKLFDNLRDYSSNLEKKQYHYEKINYSSLFKSEPTNLKIEKKISSAIDPPVEKKFNSSKVIKKISEKYLFKGYSSNKNSSSKVNSIEKKLKLIQKKNSIKRNQESNISKITTSMNNSLYINKIQNRLDMSYNLGDSQFKDRNKKYCLVSNENNKTIIVRNKIF